MNTIAHLTAAFGARQGKGLLIQDTIKTADNVDLKLNIQHAIMIKQVPSGDILLRIRKQALEANLEIADFTREMLGTTDDRKVIAQTKEKNLTDIDHLGLLIFGDKKDVEALTKELSLYV